MCLVDAIVNFRFDSIELGCFVIVILRLVTVLVFESVDFEREREINQEIKVKQK